MNEDNVTEATEHQLKRILLQNGGFLIFTACKCFLFHVINFFFSVEELMVLLVIILTTVSSD